MIQVSDWTDGAVWDDFARGACDATIMHLYNWKRVMERAYGHRTFFLAALEGDALRGVLPLTLIRSPLLSGHLVSMPFTDYGGACAGGHDEAEAALVEAAAEIAARHRAVLTLRYLRRPKLPLPCSLEKVTMFLELGTSEDALWKRLPAERRNRIRKGEKNGLVASFHGPDGLADFFTVYATNMRDLGSPTHSRRFFRCMLEELGERHARIVVVRHGGRAIGAGLCLFFNGTISIPWVSSLRPYFHLCPNQILYWEVMRFGIANGYRLLDFGRSSCDSGTFEAKRQWGAEPVQLYWYYYPESAEPPGEEVKRLAWGVNLWQRLPVPVANTIGPWLRRGIPN